MRNKINQLYIVILVSSILLIAVVLPACSTLHTPLSLQPANHCPMASLHQAEAHHLLYLKQLQTAWPGQLDLWQFVGIVAFLGLVVLSYQITKAASFNYWRSQYFYNMKPWDSFRLALAQGVIHNKHLD